MSISSIAPSPPVNPPAASAPQTPVANTNSSDNDAQQASDAPVPPPLPPGQGTRVDQFV
jgi:hypothetical protein